MQESSVRFLHCVKCGNALNLEIFEKKTEVIEGILSCTNCDIQYPIIESIPFLINDLSSYFSIRAKLGGHLVLHSRNKKIRSMIKNSLREIKQVREDTTDLEKNWVAIYKKSKGSLFEKKIKQIITKLPRCDCIIEHGCSIGATTDIISKYHGHVFGLDKSFFALLEAKKKRIKNSDYVLSDSLCHPFENKKFDLVVALNVLELIEPLELLKIISKQASRFVMLSDPYDYERGKNSVKLRLDSKSLRLNLGKMGFRFLYGTGKPSFIPWRLIVNHRLELNYKVDLVLGVILSK